MNNPINLRLIYHKVYQRKRRSSGYKLLLAEKATELAKIILEKRTIKSVQALRVVENEWLAHSTAPAKSMADEFECAIRSGNYFVEDPHLSTSHFGFNPEHGAVYAFKCSEGGTLIKIGSTKGSISQARARIKSYANRYHLSGIRILIIIEAKNPATIEQLLHKQFSPNRSSVQWNKSNEWFQISERSVRAAIEKHTRKNH